MYQVRIDFNDSQNIDDYVKGSIFYFDSLYDVTEFIETCFESNINREIVEVKHLKEK